MQNLLTSAQAMLDSLMAAFSSVSVEISHLFFMFAVEVAKGFGEKVGFLTSLGVLFLRFVCPSIVKPVDQGLLDEAPPAAKLTDLVYCAKVIVFFFFFFFG
jgi:hypothetical protein